MRRRGSAGGSCNFGEDGSRDALWLLRLAVCTGDETEVDAVSRPSGTNARISSDRVPREERESARERASPRRSSTS